MADGQSRKRKNKKQFYGDRAGKRAKGVLEAGVRGFLFTCNHRENDCRREAYSILNEYADDLYGPEKLGDDNEEVNEDDVEDALAKEIETINSKSTERRFQAVESGAKNVIFIKSALSDDVCISSFVHHILKDLLETKAKKARHCQRILPVNATCKANVSDIKQLAEKIFQPFFSDKSTALKFSIVFKARNNQSLNRDDVISSLAEVVGKCNKAHSVDLSHPDLTIVVEVIKNICCLAVVKDFVTFKKYNLHMISDETSSNQENKKETSEHEPGTQTSNECKDNINSTEENTDNVKGIKSEEKDAPNPSMQIKDTAAETHCNEVPCKEKDQET